MTNEQNIIDPPVTPYSSPEDIKAWVKSLEAMAQTTNVIDAIKQAQQWLEWQTDA